MKPAAPTHRSSSDQRSAVPLLRLPMPWVCALMKPGWSSRVLASSRRASDGAGMPVGPSSAMLSPMTRMSVGAAVWRSASIRRPPRMMIFSGLGTEALRSARGASVGCKLHASAPTGCRSSRAGCSDPAVDLPQIVVGIAEISGVSMPWPGLRG